MPPPDRRIWAALASPRLWRSRHIPIVAYHRDAYQTHRFCRGTLRVGETLVSPSSLSVPLLAIVTMADEVAPAYLSQTLYRRDARNGCAYHSISRRDWGRVAASRNTSRAPGTRTRLARNHLLDQDS